MASYLGLSEKEGSPNSAYRGGEQEAGFGTVDNVPEDRVYEEEGEGGLEG